MTCASCNHPGPYGHFTSCSNYNVLLNDADPAHWDNAYKYSKGIRPSPQGTKTIRFGEAGEHGITFATTALDKQVGGDHYSRFEIQPTVFCMKNDLDACQSNVIKYTCRHKFKGGKSDIQKAIHYLEMILELEYSESESAVE